nr:hypothetical protein Iba_chr01aCG6360 [Ipomoea batatas]GME02337.1 hypothetical protein Iba_scaffold1681734CG0010 [Ipomoea batatas]
MVKARDGGSNVELTMKHHLPSLGSKVASFSLRWATNSYVGSMAEQQWRGSGRARSTAELGNGVFAPSDEASTLFPSIDGWIPANNYGGGGVGAMGYR